MTKHANIAIRSELYCKESGYFVKKFTQSLDTFGYIHYLCTDISQGRILRGGRAKLGSFTLFGGAFVILVDGTSGTKRIQALTDKQQIDLADVEYLDLD